MLIERLKIGQGATVSNNPIALDPPPPETPEPEHKGEYGYFLHTVPRLLIIDRGTMFHCIMDREDPFSSANSRDICNEINATISANAPNSIRWTEPDHASIHAIMLETQAIHSILDNYDINDLEALRNALSGDPSDAYQIEEGLKDSRLYEELWRHISNMLDRGLIRYLARYGYYPKTTYGYLASRSDFFGRLANNSAQRYWLMDEIEKTVGLSYLNCIFMMRDREWKAIRQDGDRIYTPALHTKTIEMTTEGLDQYREELNRSAGIYKEHLPNRSLHEDIINFRPPILDNLESLELVLSRNDFSDILTTVEGHEQIIGEWKTLKPSDESTEEFTEWQRVLSILEASKTVTKFARKLAGYLAIATSKGKVLRPVLTKPDLVVVSGEDYQENTTSISPDSRIYDEILKGWGTTEIPAFRLHLVEYKVGLNGSGGLNQVRRSAMHRFMVMALSLFSRVRKVGQSFEEWYNTDPDFNNWLSQVAPQMITYTLFRLPNEEKAYSTWTSPERMSLLQIPPDPTRLGLPQTDQLLMPPDKESLLDEYRRIIDDEERTHTG
ncbi:hypothetical protein H6764_00835 [Candidatus Nomurabacteria bacterium]|nr:hypothetical protein [Candidatus Nomurabacteria bacterium]